MYEGRNQKVRMGSLESRRCQGTTMPLSRILANKYECLVEGIYQPLIPPKTLH